MNRSNTKNINIWIPKLLHIQIKVHAAHNETTVEKAAITLLEKGVVKDKEDDQTIPKR